MGSLPASTRSRELKKRKARLDVKSVDKDMGLSMPRVRSDCDSDNSSHYFSHHCPCNLILRMKQ